MSQRTLFVFNIPQDLPERELHEQFSYFGKVRHIRLMREKGYGFVEMGRPDEAATALKGVNGIVLRGSAIKVEPARSRRKHRRPHSPDHDNAHSSA
ncbi:MAG: RNA-binding protein [Acidobacteriota bacterium]|jgi:RNA recognition motif-containing protein|nr:RNA-binding protein [Acidobacteriota bacterium]